MLVVHASRYFLFSGRYNLCKSVGRTQEASVYPKTECNIKAKMDFTQDS